MRNSILPGATLFCWLLTASISFAAEPAFDCGKAESSAEKLICSNYDLAALDQDLARVYEDAVSAVRTFADSDSALKELG